MNTTASKIYLSDQIREDLVITALEGGSNYWYMLNEEACNMMQAHKTTEKPCQSQAFWAALKAGKSILVHDIETNELLGTINIESIEAGEEIMFEKYNWHYSAAKVEEGDSITADVWFQLAVMKDIVFG